MTLSLDILAARMRQGESIPLGDTARVAVALSVPAILQQLVVTAMEYIDAAMVGHIGAEATAAIGIVSSSTGCSTAFWWGCSRLLPSRSRSISGPTARRMPGACCGSP